mgnify:CR=1 FL=1
MALVIHFRRQWRRWWWRARRWRARRRAAEGTAIYSTFSLWDTYRAAAPLGLLLEPERAPDYARSLIAFSTEARVLPRWVLFGKDTGCARAASEAPARGDVRFF